MERYESYKDSGIEWIGKIPSHWGIIPLKRIMQIRNGQDYKLYTDNDRYPVIGSGGCFAYCSRFLYDGEALLLGRKGTIDKPLYIKGRFWVVDTMFYAVPKIALNVRYCYYQALTIPFDKYSTSTALPSMTQTDLGYHIFCLPPFVEQQAIVAYLDKRCSEIDKAIATQQKRIALLQELKQSIITHAVTQGIHSDVPLKDSGVEWIGKIPSHWDIIPLKRIMQIRNGQDYKLYTDVDRYPVIGSGGCFTYCSKYLYDGEALLLGRKGTIDKPLYIKDRFWVVDTMFYAVPKILLSVKYCYYQALTIPFDKYSTSTALPSMTQTDLGYHIFCLPPFVEQQAIATYLDRRCSEIDKAIATQQKRIALLQELKQSIITEVITGKIKVC